MLWSFEHTRGMAVHKQAMLLGFSALTLKSCVRSLWKSAKPRRVYAQGFVSRVQTPLRKKLDASGDGSLDEEAGLKLINLNMPRAASCEIELRHVSPCHVMPCNAVTPCRSMAKHGKPL